MVDTARPLRGAGLGLELYFKLLSVALSHTWTNKLTAMCVSPCEMTINHDIAPCFGGVFLSSGRITVLPDICLVPPRVCLLSLEREVANGHPVLMALFLRE